MALATIDLNWGIGGDVSAVHQHVQWTRGEDIELAFSPDSTAAGQDITGWTLRYLFAPYFDQAAIFDRNTPAESDGIAITNGPGGLFTVYIPVAITASSSVPKGQYVWEAWRTDGGNEDLLARGKVVVVPSSEAESALPPIVPPGSVFPAGEFLVGNGTDTVTTVDLFGSVNTWTAGQVFTSPVTIRQPLGVPGVDDLVLSHDGTRGLLRSASGGLAVRNAADTADLLSVSDGGAVLAPAGQIKSTGNLAAIPTNQVGVVIGRFADGRAVFVMNTNTGTNEGQLLFVNSNGTFFLTTNFDHQLFSVSNAANSAANWGGDLATISYAHQFNLQSTTATRNATRIRTEWADSTDATRAGRLTLAAYSVTTAQEGMRIEANAAGVRLSFYGNVAVARPAVTGSRADPEQALANLLTALANLGLVTNSTTA